MNRYEIISQLGDSATGATGGVFEALDTKLSRKVALRRFSHHPDIDQEAWKQGFLDLTHRLFGLTHPSLITVYDAGFDTQGAYVASELVPYPDLENRLLEGRLSMKEFWAMAINVLEALSVPHQEKIAHSGLSTHSIILQPRSRGDVRYRINDLGISWLIPLLNPEHTHYNFTDPAHMAPELFEDINARLVTPSTDIYMLGMIFYQALCGGHPLAGLPADEAHQKHLTHSFAPISGYRSSVPPEVSDWIELMTQADPNLRPKNAMEALAMMPKQEDIQAIYFDPPTSSVPNFQAPANDYVQEAPAEYQPPEITSPQNVQPASYRPTLNSVNHSKMDSSKENSNQNIILFSLLGLAILTVLIALII